MISTVNEIYTALEAAIYINGGHIGWAQNISIDISTITRSYDKGRFSPDMGYILLPRDITVNIGSIVSRGNPYYSGSWESLSDDNARLKDAFKLDSSRQDSVTVALLIVHEDNWDDVYSATPCCTTPDGNFIEDGAEIVGKITSYNIRTSDNELILDSVVIKGESIKWYSDAP